jgi:hypothetical protein
VTGRRYGRSRAVGRHQRLDRAARDEIATRHWRAKAQRIEDIRRATGFRDPERAPPVRVSLEYRRPLEEVRSGIENEPDSARELDAARHRELER